MSRRGQRFDQDEGSSDGVYYVSSNSSNGASFSAVSPPNSAQAARLARLSMAVHQPKENENDNYKHQHLVGDAGSHRRMIEGSSADETPRHRHSQRSWFHSIGGRWTGAKVDPPTFESPETYRAERSERMEERQDRRVAHRESREAAVVVPPDTEVEVTRDRNENRTTYNIQGTKGYMRVSAPTASNEAELFDAIADGRSAPHPQRDSHRTMSRY